MLTVCCTSRKKVKYTPYILGLNAEVLRPFLIKISYSRNKRDGGRTAIRRSPSASLQPTFARILLRTMAGGNQDTWALNVMIHMDPATMMIVKMNARVRLNP